MRGNQFQAIAPIARRALLVATGTLAAITCSSCLRVSEKALTNNQARQALEETAAAFQAETLVANTVELNTHFTIGGAVEEAAEELRDFVESQLPCADVAVEGATLRITYGAQGACPYHGHDYQGTHRITLVSVSPEQVVVDHDWDQVDNGVVMVDGAATVTWALDDLTRRVQHQLTWTDLARQADFTGSGDRVQAPLDMSWEEGIEVDGQRSWTSDRGEWHLAIDGIRAHWDDPVPEAGSYELETPFDGKTLTMGFERVDADTIAVTVESGNRSFSFNVNKLGIISE